MSFSFPSVVLHSLSASIMAYGYNQLKTLPIDALVSTQYGGHFQYLTIQGLAIAWLTTIFALASDLFPSINALRKLKRIFFMIAMPLEVVISSIYWPLLLVATHLILQPANTTPSSSSELPKLIRIPLTVDLALHAVPALSLLADFMLFETKYSRKQAVFGATLVASSFTLWYSWWVERCGRINGVYPYPFLTHNTFEGRVLIYLGAGFLAWVSFCFINYFHK
ncbi:hypothetical protein K435DRAFT_967786 [Dendrothele bispora CBS 962.96]|uniref:FAR-17a/AIG1-like protein n=1 Tax=Dendrothele bispora (strain CBS 962.96) TaxID=1314807 RepID=A0A4S8LSA0_DENBC|nr:hypothetical protein K435DRAFT_967786 [Dendrothele bispora CBS 962.96]